MKSHRMSALVALMGLSFILAIPGCQSTTDSQPSDASAIGDSRVVPILRKEQGSDPALTTMGVKLITNAEQLAALSSKKLDALAVDFDNESVILATLGERPTGGFAITLTGAQVKDNTLFVQGTAVRPGKDQVTSQALTYPYCAAVIAKVAPGLAVVPEIESTLGGEAR